MSAKQVIYWFSSVGIFLESVAGYTHVLISVIDYASVVTVCAILISLVCSPRAQSLGTKVSQYFFDICLIIGAFLLAHYCYTVFVTIPSSTGGDGAGFAAGFAWWFATVLIFFGIVGAMITSAVIQSRAKTY